MSSSIDVILIDDNPDRCGYFAAQPDAAHNALHFKLRRDLCFAENPTATIDALFGPSSALGQIVLLDLDLFEGNTGSRALDELERRGLLPTDLRAGRWPVAAAQTMRASLAIAAALLQRRATLTMILTATSYESSPVTDYLIPTLTHRYIPVGELRALFGGVDRGMSGYIDDVRDPHMFVGPFGNEIRVRTTENLARAYATFEHVFLKDRFATITAKPWRALRESLWSTSTEMAKTNEFDGINHELWAHHLPEGGDVTVPEYADWHVNVYERCLAAIRDVVPTVSTLQLPTDQFDWQSWSTLPWRAVVQFDGMAQDLTRALRTIAGYCSCGDRSVRIEVSAPDGVTGQENCLWCNASCIVEQLRNIADCFCAHLKANRLSIGTPSAATFHVAVVFGKSSVALALTQTVSFEDGTSTRIPLPGPGTPQCRGNIEAAYRTLALAGATLALSDGVLTATIQADVEVRRTLDKKRPAIWMVRAN